VAAYALHPFAEASIQQFFEINVIVVADPFRESRKRLSGRLACIDRE